MHTIVVLVNLTCFYLIGMDRLSKFHMIVEPPLKLKMWYDNLDRDYRRTLNKNVGALTKLLNMNDWPELIEVLTGYWDNERMVFNLELQRLPRLLRIFEIVSTQWVLG